MSDYQPQSLLVLFPCKHMGNLLLCLPHIQAMLAANPKNLTLVAAAYKPLVEETIGRDPRIVYFDRSAISSNRSFFSKCRYLWQLIRQLRQTGADYVVDPEAEPVSTNLMRLSGIKQSVGPSFTKRSKYYQQVISINKDAQHIFDSYGAVCRAFYPSPPAKTYLPFRRNPAAHKSLREKLAAVNLDFTQPLVLLHVAATKDYKQWPAPYFAQLADRLNNSGYQVVLIGAGQMDREKIKQVIEQAKSHLINTCDQLSLKELIALMQSATAYIGNDSGPMHLASACQIPVLALFGPTSTTTWGPISMTAKILKGSQACDPRCQRSQCYQNYACLSSLTVDTVMDALQQSVKGLLKA